MNDLAFLILAMAFFALAAAYVSGCGRLMGASDE